MKTVFVQVEPDQVIEFSNGVKLSPEMVETLRKFQLGYDEAHPRENDFIIDLQNYLVTTGDIIHQMNYHGSVPDSYIYEAIENLWNVRKTLDIFRFT